MKTAEAIKTSPWNMAKASEWLTALLAANRSGCSPTLAPPTISWVVSGQHVGPNAPLAQMPRALPHARPVPVTMEDVSKRRRISHKRSPKAALVPAGRRTSQRDQNLAAPSAAQNVAGAPPAVVNEHGAPENVAAPRAQPATVPDNVVRRRLLHESNSSSSAPRARSRSDVTRGANRIFVEAGAPLDVAAGVMGTRLRKRLLALEQAPPLGCSRCRGKPEGCDQCKRYRELWCVLHPTQQS